MAPPHACFTIHIIIPVMNFRTKARAAHGMRVVGGTLVDESDTLRNSVPDGGVAGQEAEMLTAANAGSDVAAEMARGALWSSAWDAVRMSTCFSSSGCDLPLHICKHLQELYTGGVDAEFRYSQNVKSMLEIVAVLARPRVVVDIVADAADESSTTRQLQYLRLPDGNEASADSRAGPSSKVGEVQLCRGVMSLIRTVRPVDVISFSCLVTALADLCFSGCHYVQLPSMQSPLLKMASMVPTSTDRTILFAPVDEQLRSEAGKHLLAVIQGETLSSTGGERSIGSTQASEEWLAIAGTVTAKMFLDALCSPLLCARLPSSKFTYHQSDGIPRNLQALSASESMARPIGGGFLASLARMLTMDAEEEEEEAGDATLIQTGAGASVLRPDASVVDSSLFKMIPVHVIVRSNLTALNESWCSLPIPVSALRHFSVVLQTCLLSVRSRRASDQESLAQELLVSVACLLSPWLLRSEVLTEIPVDSDISVLEVSTVTAHPQWRPELQPSDSKFVDASRESAAFAASILDAVSLHFINTPRYDLACSIYAYCSFHLLLQQSSPPSILRFD
jgi:hypothetical protein